MGKKILLVAAAFAMTVNVMAQKDITPARYVFADQKVGTYLYDEAMAGANPPNAFANAVEKFNDGYILLNNGQFGAGLGEAPNAKYIQSGSSIVDLGGEVGKVLCIKGANSTFPAGKAAEGTFNIGWWNMSFFTKGDVPIETPVRFRVVFRIIENTPDLSNGQLSAQPYTYAGDFADATAVYGSGHFIARWEDDDAPKEDGNGNPYYDDELWQVTEFDYQAGTEAGIPLRLTLHFASQAKLPNSAILIKEIKMTMNPTGEAKTEQIRLKSTTVANEDILINNKVTYTVFDNQVEFQGLTAGEKVYIYTVDGKLAKLFIANGSNDCASLAGGFYFVKSGSSALKVLVK